MQHGDVISDSPIQPAPSTCDGMSEEKKKSRAWVLWTMALLLYFGAYAAFVQGLSYATFSAGPDSTEAEHQIVWERRLPPAGILFAPLEMIDRKLRPEFWEREEWIKQSDLNTWLRDKRMQ